MSDTLTSDQSPVSDDSDVLAVLPVFMRGSDPAPIRDALVAAIRVMLTTYQDFADYAAAQSDVLTATGAYLRSKLEERGVHQLEGESEEDYRARGIGLQQVVTPAAIVAAVNSLISPLVCTYMEPSLDRMFLTNGGGAYSSFLGSRPRYPDRYYADDAVANAGVVRPSCDPGKACLFSDSLGRSFVLHVPDLSALDTSIQLAYNGTKLAITDSATPEMGGATPPQVGTPATGTLASNLGGNGIFLFDPTSTSSSNCTYLYANPASSTATYERIVATVNRLRGASIRWALYVTS